MENRISEEDWVARALKQPTHTRIKATPKGLELGRKSGLSQEQNCIILPLGTFSITEVVKNEERRKGIDEYRLIMIKYQTQWSPVYEESSRERGRPVSKDRKGIYLLKYDSFASKWNLVTFDQANANEEFSTKMVENFLRN